MLPSLSDRRNKSVIFFIHFCYSFLMFIDFQFMYNIWNFLRNVDSIFIWILLFKIFLYIWTKFPNSNVFHLINRSIEKDHHIFWLSMFLRCFKYLISLVKRFEYADWRKGDCHNKIENEKKSISQENPSHFICNKLRMIGYEDCQHFF